MKKLTAMDGLTVGPFDTRLIAQVQLARVAQGEAPLPPIMHYPDDESKVWVLTTDNYVLFDKQEIADGFAKFTRQQLK